jgi:hypothetical protein
MGTIFRRVFAVFAALAIARSVGAKFARAEEVPLQPLTQNERTQLGWCMNPQTLNWKSGDVPTPLTVSECTKLAARAMCLKASTGGVTAEIALRVRAGLHDLIKAPPLTASALIMQRTLSTMPADDARAMATMLRCVDSVLSGPDLASAKAEEIKAFAWADVSERAVSAEQTIRDAVVTAVCGNDQALEQARIAMERERSNPSGYVDKALLHQLGSDIQSYQEQLARLAPAYQAARHHPFQGWRTEGACVAMRDP